MSGSRELHPLEERVLAGGSRDLQLAAARGLLPLPPERLVALQVRLQSAEEPEIAQAARNSLESVDLSLAADFVAAESEGALLLRFVTADRQPPVLEAALRNRDAPPELLIRLAPTLQPQLQEILLRREDAIVGHPEILDALESNPGLTAFAKGKIEDQRLHLLRKEPEPVEPEVEAAITDEADDETVVAAIEKVRTEEPADGTIDDGTGLSETQIRLLPIPVKLRLSRGATGTLKKVLIFDKAPIVALSVLNSNPFSDTEIERIAGNRNMSTDILDTIARTRLWNSKYKICKALVGNPKTTTGIAVKMVPRLSVRDLGNMSRDHNVSAAVKSAAQRLYMIKRR